MNGLRIARAWLAVLLASTSFAAAADQASQEGEAFFEKHIRPLLVERCAECHGEKEAEAGLRLDVRSRAMAGGDSGPVIAPGNPDGSRLIQVVRYDQQVQMPPDGKLPDEAVAALTEWVSRGAPWPEHSPESLPAPTEGSPSIDEAAKTHWAFQPVVSPEVPSVANAAWCQSPIDFFVLAELESRGLTPNELCDRRTLIRRMTYDLTGLPPTFEEVQSFVEDTSPDAVAKLVDRLLASPRYGERWGRHWLDLARYADTKGYVGVGEGDIERREYPYAYSYRDWVIKSLNEDLPYDAFLIQQIAADKLPAETREAALPALGFFRVGRVFLNNKRDQIDDKIDVLMRGTQGLTVACARCHDHKFDPIPTADYYSLYGIFDSTKEPDDADRKLMLLADADNPHNVPIFKRGNPDTPGDTVPRQFLAVLSGPERKPFTDGSGRLELANAIASSENPLTARVMVNRVWAHHFGKGLVDTASDFGIRTPRPVHARLLDYLAHRFMAEGWSMKRLHRWILLSSTYQQSSPHRSECAQVDPENRLHWRANRQRLDFEQLRDSMLAVSGELDLTMGGPSVELTKEPFSLRRTVYGRVDRQNLPAMFRTFDFANPDSHSAGRFQTTVPQQGLFLLNHPFVLDRARGLVKRLDDTGLNDTSARIEALYRWTLIRDPSDEELHAASALIEQGTANVSEQSQEANFGPWHRLAQALLLTNEFMFVD